MWQQIVNWLLTSVQEKYKFRTCCVQKLFFKAFKTIFVHNMFWTCIFLVLKSVVNEKSLSYYGLTDSSMSASEKDLPVP